MQSPVSSIATDGAYVYVARDLMPQLVRIPVGGGAPFDLAPSYVSLFAPGGIRTDGKNLYFSDLGNSGRLCSVPVGGGSVTILAATPDPTRSIAIDSVNLYARGTSGIYSVPLAGGALTKLASSDGASTTSDAIAIDGKNVVWIQFSPSHDLLSVPVAGGSVTSIAYGQPPFNTIGSGGGYIYFMSSTMGRVQSDGQWPGWFSGAPLGQFVADNNLLYVASLDGIWRFDPSLNKGVHLVDLFSTDRIAVDSTTVYWTDTSGNLFRAPK